MEKETSISNDIKEKFKQLSKKAVKEYDIHTQLVQIVGKRWSYVAGEIIHDPKYEVEKIRLSKDIGIIVYLPKGHTVSEEKIRKIFQPLLKINK